VRGIVKQVAVSLLVLVVGLGLWVRFFPGAGAVLERFGMGAAQVEAAEPLTAQKAGGQKAAGQKAGGQAGATAGGRGGRGARDAVVVVQPAGSAVLNDHVAALGTASARASVTVMPRDAGRLTEVLVSSGAQVEAGQVLAKLDSAAEAIALDKAQVAYDDAMQSLERNAALVKAKTVAASQAQAVELAAKVAELNLRTAKQDLDDRTIVAPIAGVVGIIDVTAGSEVTTQTEIARIEDASVLRVDFYLPERLSGQVKVGDAVQMVAVARPQEALKATIAALDNQVDAASGSFRVQADLDNAAGSLRPGMALTVNLQMPGDSFVAVNPLSVLWGSDGAYVWRMVDGKSQKAMVRIVQRNTEAVLVAGDLAAGDAVITEGLDGLKEGGAVKVFGAADPAADPAAAANPDAGAKSGARAGKAAAGKPAAAVGN
jgi:RND family efflux transporter MFP subunit